MRNSNNWNISDIADTDAILKIPYKYQYQILLEYLNSIGNEITSSEENKNHYALLSMDMFSAEIDESTPSDIENIVTKVHIITQIIRSLITKSFLEKEKLQELFKIIEDLPESAVKYKLKLFTIAQNPNLYKDKLMVVFSEIFEDNYISNYQLLWGTEYLKSLSICYKYFSQDCQEKYLHNIIATYDFLKTSKTSEGVEYKINDCLHIFSIIKDNLSEAQMEEINKRNIEIDIDYQPHPAIGTVKSGIISPVAPISQEDLSKLSVQEIVDNLKEQWSPKQLTKTRKSQDTFTFNPINAEGLSATLKEDMKQRLEDYIENAERFFDRENLDPQYTYAYLEGLKNHIQNKTCNIKKLSKLIYMLTRIVNSGNTDDFDYQPHERGFADGWLANWGSVHLSIARLIIKLENIDEIIKVYQTDILKIIQYLLKSPDPYKSDEEIDTARMTTKAPSDEHFYISDPGMIAINSVRGVALQALTQLVVSKSKQINIEQDIKNTYENLIKNEKTRSIMFLIGYYLWYFYYMDQNWLIGLIDKLFMDDQEHHYLYIAAWEGYLCSNLHEELFNEEKIQQLYRKAIKLENIDYPNQKHTRNPNEALANHLALSYMHYEKIDIRTELIREFLDNNNIVQVSEFISFIGRKYIIANNDEQSQYWEKHFYKKEALKDVWEYLLDNNTHQEIMQEFGWWVEFKDDIFKSEDLVVLTRRTLEKTGGILDRYYELGRNIEKIASVNSIEFEKIARLTLLNGFFESKLGRFDLRIDELWINAFHIAYKENKLQDEIKNLVNDLIAKGGQHFYILKDIIKD